MHEWRAAAACARAERWCSRVPRWSRVTLTRYACASPRFLTNVRRPPHAVERFHHRPNQYRHARHPTAVTTYSDVLSQGCNITILLLLCSVLIFIRYIFAAETVYRVRGLEAFGRRNECQRFGGIPLDYFEPIFGAETPRARRHHHAAGNLQRTWFFPCLAGATMLEPGRPASHDDGMCFLTAFGRYSRARPHLASLYKSNYHYIIILNYKSTLSRWTTAEKNP